MTTLAGVIYVHRISDNRFGGITGRNFSLFRKLCGESTLRNVVLVTNMWERGSWEYNEARENELSSRFFKPALDKGAQMVRHHNTAQSAHDIIRMITRNHPVVLQIQRELVDEHKDIIDTAAGEDVSRELGELTRRHKDELKTLKEEMMQALMEKDEEMKYRLEWETVRLKLEEMGWSPTEVRTERQPAEAGYNRQFTALLQEAANAVSPSDRARWEQEIQRLRDRMDDSSSGDSDDSRD